MSSLIESVLIALTEALPIAETDRLLCHLARSWRAVTQADAVFLGACSECDGTVRGVMIDQTGLVTDVDFPGDNFAHDGDAIARKWELVANDRPVGLLTVLGGDSLADSLAERFRAATAELIARLMTRERKLRDARLESLAEFAAGAGHEINNPLAAISGRAQLLLRGERDQQRRQHLVTIGAQALRIRDMIGDTMLFARPPRPERQVIRLCEIVGAVVEKFADDLERRKLTVQRCGATDVPIFADEIQLRVVVSELIRNAIEASPAGGTIGIDASREKLGEQDWARFIIRDEGGGLSEEAAARLFDPFYSGRPAGRGLGFGLSKCWRIVTNHGGRIAIDDGQSSGFGIIVEWPASRPKSAG